MLYRVSAVDIVPTGHPLLSDCDVTRAKFPVPTQNVFRPQTGQTTQAAAIKNKNISDIKKH